ncbi:hypothetical protein ACWGSK_18130 [Nocardiopsis sp. NPDC055551]
MLDSAYVRAFCHTSCMPNPPQHPHGNPVPPAPFAGPGHPGGPSEVPASAQKKTSVARDYRWSIGLTIAAVLLFVPALSFGLNPAFPTPDIEERISGTDRITFEVIEGETRAWGVYSDSETTVLPCRVFPPEEDWEYTYPEWDKASHLTFGDWRGEGILDTPEPGTYTLACVGDDEYALGASGPLRMVHPIYNILAMVILGVVPSLTFAAIVVAVVTTVRRRSAVRQS